MPIVQPFSGIPASPHNQSADISVIVGGDIFIGGASPTSANFSINVGGDINIGGEFVFEIPPPFIDEIEENAFSGGLYTARLRDNFGNTILITDASRDRPKGEIGEKISITVGKKDLNQISTDKLYTFEIGTWVSIASMLAAPDAPDWETVCENARLQTRNFSVGRSNGLPADSLSFEIVESSKNKLNFFPVRNFILYDSLQTSVSLDESEKVYTSDGDYIRTTANAFPNLTFYKILDFIKTRCGFSGFETNLPNFPVIRADFPFNRSYAKSLAGVAGMYEPVFSLKAGNILRVQTKFADLPDDFQPQEITVLNYSALSLQIPSSAHVDGASLTYLDNSQADYFTDRLVQTTEETGTFGNPDFTRTSINRTFRDWFVDENPESPVRTALITEVHSVYDASLILIGRETNNHTYDFQGRRTNSSREIESYVPNLNDDGNLLLQTVREENQTVFYTTDPRRSKKQIQSKTVTQISGLVSSDAENQYFENDFRQDLLEAHKAGNLTASMTQEFGLLKTITETLTPLGNNQFEVRTHTVDHLRNATTNASSEPKTGDASLNAVGGRSRNYILWADGVSISSRTGGEIIEIVGGEVPLRFLKVLAGIILERRIGGFQEGSLTVPGYDESLDRGVFFRVFDRDGNVYGRFIAEAVRTDFNRLGVAREQRVVTTVSISEV